MGTLGAPRKVKGPAYMGHGGRTEVGKGACVYKEGQESMVS